MIPIRDINPTTKTPILVYSFIAINIAVFLFEVSLSDKELQAFIFRFGVVPYLLVYDFNIASLSTPFTSMFLHGGWLHLIGNMWFLYIFGDNVEDALGVKRFAIFYLLSGLLGALAQVWVAPSSEIPMVGASGAIAGVLGGYFRLYPRARVIALIPIFLFFFVRELPAVIFILFWFLIQLFSGLGSLGINSGGGGVAFFAHIGGFLGGFVLVKWMRPPRNRTLGWRKKTSQKDISYWN